VYPGVEHLQKFLVGNFPGTFNRGRHEPCRSDQAS